MIEKKTWNYVEKDGNPTEPGMYWVTLIYREWKGGKPTGRKLATVGSRYFADLDKESNMVSWIMDGEPKTGLAWTEETGSYSGEKVYAWMPIENIEIAKLPEGIVAVE